MKKMPPTMRLLISVLSAAPAPMTYRQLTDQTGAAIDTVKDYVRQLETAGLVTRQYTPGGQTLISKCEVHIG